MSFSFTHSYQGCPLQSTGCALHTSRECPSSRLQHGWHSLFNCTIQSVSDLPGQKRVSRVHFLSLCKVEKKTHVQLETANKTHLSDLPPLYHLLHLEDCFMVGFFCLRFSKCLLTFPVIHFTNISQALIVCWALWRCWTQLSLESLVSWHMRYSSRRQTRNRQTNRKPAYKSIKCHVDND